jgi:ADP-heptose:LPS heptosyltransferase
MIIEKPVQILVRRRAAIGDVIMSTAVVRELKNRYGDDCQIDVSTEFIDIYRNNPHIRNIYPAHVMPDPRDYDIYINLDDAYELNPKNHYVDSYFHRALGGVDFAKQPELFSDQADRDQVDQDLELIDRQFIVVHMRNWHWASKNVSFATWMQVFERVYTETTDVAVVCVGGETDFALDQAPLFYDFRSRYNSQQISYLISQAQCFVGIDSGPFHCAAATDTHIVALLTHLHPDRIVPYRHGTLGWNTTAIQTLEDCRGCNDEQIRPVRQLVCKKQTYPCSENWEVEAIAKSITGTLV